MHPTFFDVEQRGGHEWFVPNDGTRGPWDADACHAGPPAALIARASELAVPDQQLVRLTVDLTRPIPFAGFAIETEVLRTGRTVTTTAMTLIDCDDRPIVTARGMHLAEGPDQRLPTARTETPRFADSTPGPFPFLRKAHDLPAFGDAVSVRYPAGEDPECGPTTIWLQALRLLPGERTSEFQRICALADCGNAISRNSDDDIAFVNTDLTIYIHRIPMGRWFGSQAISRWERNGIGMADALLFDEHGPVGRAIQGLVVRPTP